MRAHMGGLPETHITYHSTHSTDITTDHADVCRPCYRLNTYNIIQRDSRHRNVERQLSSDAQRERLYARDEEHFSLRDEVNARTQLLQKIPLCGRPASLEAAHREDQGFGQGKDCFRL